MEPIEVVSTVVPVVLAGLLVAGSLLGLLRVGRGRLTTAVRVALCSLALVALRPGPQPSAGARRD
jgi:hypothetical protein